MELAEYFREPTSAALSAAAITALYIHFKAYINNEKKLELNEYAKPAALNAILVYFIVSNGIGQRETISMDPF
jgi:hypothetical protein